MSILGQVVLRANGKQLKSKKGATLNPGGDVATSHLGPGVSWGASYEYQEPSIDFVIAAAEDVDVIEINKMKNVTITWEGDNGIDYMMTGCSPKEPFKLSDSGDITGTFRGNKLERI